LPAKFRLAKFRGSQGVFSMGNESTKHRTLFREIDQGEQMIGVSIFLVSLDTTLLSVMSGCRGVLQVAFEDAGRVV
jgi:hypothetical protein